ncbi:hypothetical protein LIER_08687 [Lithospermum erythrorhizon]|uniref:Uncharacterized protein n=1 Tax=Lithospermum erythrorhizon TaxID=34254 RepID=A0AAV3PF17_LITER
MRDAVPKRCTLLTESSYPKFNKIALIKAQIATLKRPFENPLHFKVFCEKGVLIHACLICSKEFDQSMVPPINWDEVLAAAAKTVEPNQVPFSTMTGNRVPLFRRTKVVKKSSKEPGVSTGKVVQPEAIETSTYVT